MFCNFIKINSDWICDRCGRKVPINQKKDFMPSAKCRLPEFYHLKSRYIYNYQTKGVGDFLLDIFKKLNHGIPSLCTARAKATYLNNKGIEWCEENQKTILAWIQQECITYKVTFLEKVFSGILRLAIRKAKSQKIPTI